MDGNLSVIGAATALAVLLGGCTTPGNVAKEAVDANLAFERQNNDLLLLNVMRASKDLPMHFSRVNTLRLTAGTVGLSAKGIYPSLASLPVIGSGAQLGSAVQRGGLELGLAAPGLPALDVTPMDGQEYMQGIMSPVPIATLPVLSELGWPSELILYLLIDSISVKVGDKTDLLQNDPRQPDGFNDFSKFISDLKPNECVLVSKNADPVRYTPDYTPMNSAQPTLEGAVAAKAGGLAPVAASGGAFYFGITPKQVALKCTASTALERENAASTGSVKSLWQNTRTADVRQLLRERFAVKPRSESEERVNQPGAAAVPEITATLRSPYGVLTYLGALHQRNQRGLFQVSTGRGDAETVIARADLLGESYHLPASLAGTSTAKSMAIAWQLLQLQSKGNTAPVTGTVRLAQ